MKIGDKLYKYTNEPPVENEAEQEKLEREQRNENGQRQYRHSYADMAVWCNQNNATIEDKWSYVEIVAIPAPTHEEELVEEKNRLLSYLSQTDWIVVKCLERNLNMQEAYPTEYKARGDARTRINEIDEELK